MPIASTTRDRKAAAKPSGNARAQGVTKRRFTGILYVPFPPLAYGISVRHFGLFTTWHVAGRAEGSTVRSQSRLTQPIVPVTARVVESPTPSASQHGRGVGSCCTTEKLNTALPSVP